MKDKDIIDSARKRFDDQLHTDGYKKIHSDAEHLENLIKLFDIINNKSYLDIGTGSGYMAFELAERFDNVKVYGLDIAVKSIEKNNSIKEEKGIKNIYFNSFNGINYPYTDKMFYGAVSRYAFHHFPDINKTMSELNRIIEDHGFFILSDPLTYDEDRNNFIDEFQSMMPDGHVHFYRREEIDGRFKKSGFFCEKEFYSYVTYPRDINDNYIKLFDKTSKEILDKYKIEIKNDRIFITVKVMNILFRRKACITAGA